MVAPSAETRGEASLSVVRPFLRVMPVNRGTSVARHVTVKIFVLSFPLSLMYEALNVIAISLWDELRTPDYNYDAFFKKEF